MADNTKKRPEEFPCATCALRAKAKDNPKSFSARLWRWHTYICPGWKMYQRALNDA